MIGVISKSRLWGSMDVSQLAPSKSILHREMIACALAGEAMPKPTSIDTRATYQAMEHIFDEKCELNAYESGSTLRFLIPLSIYLGGRCFTVSDSLAKRPISTYNCITTGKITARGNKIYTEGSIKRGKFSLPGDISSQFVTGLLLVLPLLDGDSEIILTTPLESSSYVQQTIDVLKNHSIEITETAHGYYIKGNQKYKNVCGQIEGDWSYAAFFAVANSLGAGIELTGLNYNSTAADKQIINLLDSTEIDISQCPDLFPALCVRACGRLGKTLIYNGKRLRLKESDRLNAMGTELKKLGADLAMGEDYIEIYGTGSLTGGTVSSHKDHRIAMALAIAGCTICRNELLIEGAECVAKSCPDFFKHIISLGGNVVLKN